MYFYAQFFLRLLLWIFSHNQSTFFSNSLVLGAKLNLCLFATCLLLKTHQQGKKKSKHNPKILAA